MSKTYARSTLIENIRKRFSWLEWKEGNLKMLRKVIVLSHVWNIVEATYSEMTSFLESISKIEFTLILCIDQERG
jgi:hypothetical protein